MRRQNRFDRVLIRVTDAGLALLLAVFLAPLWGAVSLAVLVKIGRPIFVVRSTPRITGPAAPCLRFRTTYSDSGYGRRPALGDFLERSRLVAMPRLLSVLRGDLLLIDQPARSPGRAASGFGSDGDPSTPLSELTYPAYLRGLVRALGSLIVDKD